MAGFSFRTLLSQLRTLGEQPEERSANLIALEHFGDGIFSTRSSAGKNVTNDSALTHSAVWASIRLLSETIAALPFQVMEKTAEGRKLAGWHPLYKVVHNQPNGKMSSYSFRVAMMHHVLSGGNFFAHIHREMNEADTWLEVLDPKQVEIREDVNALYYKYKADGRTIQSYDMLHIKGFSFDGVVGLSPIAYARESIGAGLAAQEYSGELLGNGITATGVIEMDGMPKAEQIGDLKQQLSRQFRGGKGTNKDGIAVLYGGMKFNRIAIPPVDAQFLEQRKFSVTEIARIFRVPPHMIGDLDRATFSNIEHQAIEFVQYSLLPWIKSIEMEFDSKLFKESDKSRFGVKLSVEGLLRGDVATRAAYYQAAINSGWMTRNEARQLENMSKLDGGDVPLVPVNLTTVEKLTADEQQGN